MQLAYDFMARISAVCHDRAAELLGGGESTLERGQEAVELLEVAFELVTKARAALRTALRDLPEEDREAADALEVLVLTKLALAHLQAKNPSSCLGALEHLQKSAGFRDRPPGDPAAHHVALLTFRALLQLRRFAELPEVLRAVVFHPTCSLSSCLGLVAEVGLAQLEVRRVAATLGLNPGACRQRSLPSWPELRPVSWAIPPHPPACCSAWEMLRCWCWTVSQRTRQRPRASCGPCWHWAGAPGLATGVSYSGRLASLAWA